ncbi:glycine betaine/proline transport system substrate-binding protein [Amaricoccus macauensis]|uniref:Glycine betaine/proline transport system substrate-binding protein n=1 Tax=Amaricoccus macauensis TaxID=57001 RepID=A0A840SGP6_9RHOB|nr:choline ABC transporter substrate-binding protein [Amaricoccus macauensis]MBB5222159.1 glycine betaine/proline transport system substrate-binding protein [Amaricoccus macauensis]
MKPSFTALLAALALAVPALSTPVLADDAACQTVRMSDPGWSDITSTNALASTVLDALGYKADVKSLSVPIGYEALKVGDLDVFLGNWMPAQQHFRDDLDKAKAAEVLVRNLEGAKFTLGVPSYVAEAGVKDFKDLAPNADKFDDKIYGIESGAPANQNLQKMIDADDFGLKGWSVVESGEQAMLAQVKRAEKAEDWIVFLAWAPHPMNNAFDITYLTGGDAYFGPNYGGAEVYTLARTGWPAQCPNAATFFRNLTFTVPMENDMMALIAEEDPESAAKGWLKQNAGVLDGWLAGVTTFDGEPGLAAVQKSLGL